MSRKSPRVFSPEKWVEVKALLDQGVSIAGAARQAGIPWRSVNYRFSPGAKEKQLAQAKRWVLKNLERNRANQRKTSQKYRDENPMRGRLAKQRAYWKNPEKYRAIGAKYRKEHPEKVKAYKKKAYLKIAIRRKRIRAMLEMYKGIIKAKNK